MKILTDREKRRKFFIAIGVIIAIPIFLVIMFWYIITAPLRWLEGLFSSDEIAQVAELRQEMGFPSWELEAGIVDGFYCPFPSVNWIVTSPFGLRVHPITGVQDFHEGIDISWYNAYGVPIGAVADGVVTFAGYSSSAGHWVIIYHGDMGEYLTEYGTINFRYRGVVSVYMHNSSNLVSAGDIVEAGDIIGFLGNSGHSTGPHLHLEIRTGGFNGLSGGRASGAAQDPLLFIGLPGMRDIEVDGEDKEDG